MSALYWIVRRESGSVIPARRIAFGPFFSTKEVRDAWGIAKYYFNVQILAVSDQILQTFDTIDDLAPWDRHTGLRAEDV